MTTKLLNLAVLVAFIAGAALPGCSTGRSQKWVDDKVAFASYQAIEIRPIFDATGDQLPAAVTEEFTRLLTEEFAGLDVPIETSATAVEGVLVVKSDILVYESCHIAKYGTSDTGLATPSPGGNAGSRPITKSVCTTRTQLIDKANNKIVAEIYTTREVGACFTSQYRNDWLQDVVVEDIVDQVDTIMTTRK